MKSIVTTAIAIGVVLAIAGLALWYVIREKKKGKRCIGCSCGSCTGCHK